MFGCILSLVLCAGEPVRLAAPNLTGTQIPAERTSFYTDRLAQELTYAGLDVITQGQMAALVGQERQQQLLGCSDAQASCLTELSNALGADGLVLGQVARLGKRYQLDVRVLGTNARELANYSGSAADESQLLELFRSAAASLAASTRHALHREIAPPPPSLRDRAWIPAVGAAVSLGAAAVLYGLAAGAHGKVLESTYLDDAQRLAQQGRTYQTLSAVGLGVGLAAGAAAGVLFWMGGRPQPVVAAGPGGASIGIRGHW